MFSFFIPCIVICPHFILYHEFPLHCTKSDLRCVYFLAFLPWIFFVTSGRHHCNDAVWSLHKNSCVLNFLGGYLPRRGRTARWLSDDAPTSCSGCGLLQSCVVCCYNGWLDLLLNSFPSDSGCQALPSSKGPGARKNRYHRIVALLGIDFRFAPPLLATQRRLLGFSKSRCRLWMVIELKEHLRVAGVHLGGTRRVIESV